MSGKTATQIVQVRSGNSTSLWTIIGGRGQVDVISLPPVTVEGEVAHDSSASGVNPLLLGHYATSLGTSPTAVTAGDVTRWYAHRHGVPFTIGGHPNVECLYEKNTASATDEVLKAAASNRRFVVTSVSAFVDHACTVDVQVLIELGAATVLEHPGIAPGSGFSVGDGSGILAIGGVNTSLLLTNEVPTDGSVSVTVTGFMVDSA